MASVTYLRAARHPFSPSLARNLHLLSSPLLSSNDALSLFYLTHVSEGEKKLQQKQAVAVDDYKSMLLEHPSALSDAHTKGIR